MKTKLLILGLVGLALVLSKTCKTFGWCKEPYVYFAFLPKCYDEPSDTYYVPYGQEITIDADIGVYYAYDPDCSGCDECDEGSLCSGDDLIRGLRKYKWYFGDGTIEQETCSSQDDGDFDAETTHTYTSTGPMTLKVRVYDVDETCDNGCPPGWDDQYTDLSKSIVVVRVDLDMGSQPDETKEESDGAFLALNDDDDNDNGFEDRYDGPGGAEDDMSSLSFSISPSIGTGNVKLDATAGSSNIRVFEDSTKSTLVTLPKTWHLPSESLPTGNYYVEGYNSSSTLRDTELTLSYIRNGCTVHSDKVKITVIDVDYAEDTTTPQKYGYDSYTDAFFPYKSVEVNDTDTVYADISGTSSIASEVYFTSSNTSYVTVSPSQASSTHEQVTFTGVAEGWADGRAELYDPASYDIYAGHISVYPYDEDPYTVAIRVVHEDDDDTQPIDPYQGLANQTAITAGGNGTLDTTAVPDDAVVGTTITTGADGVCNTTASGDDTQVIDPGKGLANQICVSFGANGYRDTVKAGDDEYTGASIHTGPDGICNTTADNTPDLSDDPFATAAVLQGYLNNTIYNQSVVNWSVTKLDPCTVPFDLDCDGYIDISSWTTSEMNVVIGECEDDTFDFNIFIVNNPSITTACGIMNFPPNTYGFVHPDNCTSCVDNTTAHELGHGAFNLKHPDQQVPPDHDTDNLMHSSESCPELLRKGQWVTIQSFTTPP